jgi:hypothetical protein
MNTETRAPSAAPAEVLTQVNAWLARNDKNVYIVNSAKAYSVALAALGFADDETLTAERLELAFQCLKLKVQDIAANLPGDPRAEGFVLRVLFEGGEVAKELYGQAGKPHGPKFAPADIRAHYERIRGKLNG